MPRPGQSRERRPDNRHPSHSIEIRTRNLKESADRHGRHPRRFFPSFRCTNHRPSGSAHTVQPRRHENTSPTGKPDYGEKRGRCIPTATRGITAGIDSALYGHLSLLPGPFSSSRIRISLFRRFRHRKRLCPPEPYRFKPTQPLPVVQPPDRQDSGFCTTNSYINGV